MRVGDRAVDSLAVSVSLACEAASVPVAWQLYLPREWADDPARCGKTGIPEALQFATKPAIALKQIEHPMSRGAPRHHVVANAGYGVDTPFRERLSELDLHCPVHAADLLQHVKLGEVSGDEDVAHVCVLLPWTRQISARQPDSASSPGRPAHRLA